MSIWIKIKQYNDNLFRNICDEQFEGLGLSLLSCICQILIAVCQELCCFICIDNHLYDFGITT